MKKSFHFLPFAAIIWGLVSCGLSSKCASKSTIGNSVENGHEYIDLGLSVKWATCNVGATKPEEYGDYFSWGETKPKSSYDWSNYKHGSADDSLTKYCTDTLYGRVDNKTTLDLADDAARANWGGAWRVPTLDEQKELLDNCTWTFTKENGVAGHKITGSNSNSIFLPVTGYRDGTNLYDESAGYYWSASRYTNDLSYYLYFTNHRDLYKYDRCLGFTVRAVVTKEKIATTLENVELPAILVENGRVSCASEFRIYDTLGRDVTKDNGNLKGVFVVKGTSFVEKIVVR